jgi:hypothetical protein
MGVAENVSRFVLAADALVNAMSTVIVLHKNGSAIPVAVAERFEAAQNEYDAAREALIGPIDAGQPEPPHTPL